MKNLAAKRLIALLLVIALSIAVGTTIQPITWYMDGAFNFSNIPFVVIIYTCSWIVLGAFMGVVIRSGR